jgi:tRNA (cmo5U34)-methyltransferase
MNDDENTIPKIMADTFNTVRTQDTPAKDNVLPDGKWAFDQEVTDAFDDMLVRSIPQYEVMRSICYALGVRFVERALGTAIVDLGCARGAGLAPFVDRFGAYNRFVGVDVSGPMLSAARARFDGYIRSGVVDIRDCDLRKDYPPVKASLTLAVLTLQFVPIEYRQMIVRKVYDSTEPGGAFLLVEKVIGSAWETDFLMTELYLANKAKEGYTPDQIDRKRLALEGVLVPVAAHWNEDMLKAAGFKVVECVWRWLNFAAWIAVKEGSPLRPAPLRP